MKCAPFVQTLQVHWVPPMPRHCIVWHSKVRCLGSASYITKPCVPLCMLSKVLYAALSLSLPCSKHNLPDARLLAGLSETIRSEWQLVVTSAAPGRRAFSRSKSLLQAVTANLCSGLFTAYITACARPLWNGDVRINNAASDAHRRLVCVCMKRVLSNHQFQ